MGARGFVGVYRYCESGDMILVHYSDCVEVAQAARDEKDGQSGVMVLDFTKSPSASWTRHESAWSGQDGDKPAFSAGYAPCVPDKYK